MSEITKQKIVNRVEKERENIVDFLKKLIQIKSETGEEETIQHFIAETLKNIGLEIDKWTVDLNNLKNHPAYIPVEDNFKSRPNIVGIFRGRGGGKSLLLNGHVDTITSEPVEQWHYSPYSGKVIGDKIYGRGASDMKSGLAAMTMAVKVLKDLNFKPGGNIFLEYVVDEEVTGYGTLSAILRGYQADAGICCETSDLAIQPACIGRLWFRIEIAGKTSSISNKWESVSAINKGIKIINAVDGFEKIRLNELKHPLYPDNRGALPCTVCMFESGSFPSAIPEHALLRGSMGLFPYEDVSKVEEKFMDYIYCVSQSDSWLKDHRPKITFKDLGADGAEIPIDSLIVKEIKKSFQKITNTEPIISGREGGSDSRYLIKYGNTPTIIFGPGATKQMHATNEFVSIENLITATKVLAHTIYKWCRRS